MHATHLVIDSINRTLTEFSEIWESQLFCSNCFSRRFISSCLSSQSLENDVMDGWLQFPALLDGTCASSSCAWCLSTLKGDLISCAKESFSRNFGDPCRKGSNKLEGDGAQKESSVHEDYRIGVVSKKHQGKRVATNHKETEVLPQKPSSISPSNLPQRRTFFLKQFYWDPIEILFWEWLLSTIVTVLHISIRVDLGQDGSSLCVAKLKAHRYVCGDSITNCRKYTYLKTWQLEPNMQNQTQWKSRGPILLSLVIGQRRGQWQELKTYMLTVPGCESTQPERRVLGNRKYGQRKGNRKVGTNTRM